jgi:putative OPT family oligopeptide transporter
MKWVLLGSLAIIVAMWLMLTFNPIAGARTSGFENLVASFFVVLFGFLFVTVSSRICGLIGTSANPVSGMTIATLMATCAMFLAMGWTAPAYSALAITIGGVVCVAAANAGATSQDLKTGFLIGATPYRQQWALMIGVMVSVFVIGGTLMLMNFGLSEFRPVQRRSTSSRSAPSRATAARPCASRRSSTIRTRRSTRTRSTSSSTRSARASCPTASISTIPTRSRSKCSGSRGSAATRRPRPRDG